MNMSVIVAVAENGVVGRDNALPWHLPSDLQYFKRKTMGKPIVMGRKTFESIGRPLPGRANIIVSRSQGYSAKGAYVVESVDRALALAEELASADGEHELMVIGGASIYAAAIPFADTLYITEVHAEIEGDVRLPVIDWSVWQEVSRHRHAAEGSDSHEFSFVEYRRGS